MEQFHFLTPPPTTTTTTTTLFPCCIPLIDLSKPDSKNQIVKACEEFGFFKLINHGIPTEFITRLEHEATEFFSLPLIEKQKVGPANPFGYGNNKIGSNGDVGWVEYLLMTTNPQLENNPFSSIFTENPDNFRSAMNEYVRAVKGMACEVLELMADGLKIEERDVFSKLVKHENSDSLFRLNHYPPYYPDNNLINNNNNNNNGRIMRKKKLVGFGEHTDPQIISVLRSNNASGLEISLKNGNWVSVPPDQNSFFINVGDSLQVMTNGRFKSVRHRVVTNRWKSRISMIYFGGPPMTEKIAPLPSLLTAGDQTCTSLYKEFTWFEFKKSAFNSKLAQNRLLLFEKIAAN